ncbi:MAG TPA: hypothetical protein VLO00_00805, partial [Cryobacterium sp.]|nr:hypothetical protein [Cryobacterium sp.]
MTTALPHELIESEVADAALERLLVGAGARSIHKSDGPDWTISGPVPRDTVEAVNEVRRAIHVIYAAQDEIAGALVRSQDDLLALRALTQVNVSTLGVFESFQDLLRESRDLTSSDAVALLDDRLVQSSGGPGSDSEAFAELLLEAADETGDLEPRLASGGHAVIAPLVTPGGGVRVLAFLRVAGPVYSTGDLRLVRAAVAAANMRFTLTRLHLLEIKRATFEREHEVASSLAQAVFSQP